MTKYTMTKRSKLGYLKDDEGKDILVQETPRIRTDRVKRNKPCRCNSGKKFKVCCDPGRMENDNRWAAKLFAQEYCDSTNVKGIGISGGNDIYILLHNDYKEFYPETYECLGKTYHIHVQFNTSNEVEPDVDTNYVDDEEVEN